MSVPIEMYCGGSRIGIQLSFPVQASLSRTASSVRMKLNLDNIGKYSYSRDLLDLERLRWHMCVLDKPGMRWLRSMQVMRGAVML